MNPELSKTTDLSQVDIVLFTGPNCSGCIQLKSFLNVNQSLVNGKLILESDISTEDGRNLAQKHGVRSVPSVLVLNNGEVSERLEGVMNAIQFFKR